LTEHWPSRVATVGRDGTGGDTGAGLAHATRSRSHIIRMATLESRFAAATTPTSARRPAPMHSVRG
jgi:hypothetical protein